MKLVLFPTSLCAFYRICGSISDMNDAYPSFDAFQRDASTSPPPSSPSPLPPPLSHSPTAPDSDVLMTNVQHLVSLFPAPPLKSTNRSILVSVLSDGLSDRVASEFLHLQPSFIHNARYRVKGIQILESALFSHYPPFVHRHKVSDVERELIATFIYENCPLKRSDLSSDASPHLQYDSSGELYQRYVEQYPSLLEKIADIYSSESVSQSSLQHLLYSLLVDEQWQLVVEELENSGSALGGFFHHNLHVDATDDVWGLVREYLGPLPHPRCRQTFDTIKTDLNVTRITRCFLGTRCQV